MLRRKVTAECAELFGLALHDGEGLRVELQVELLAVGVDGVVDLDLVVLDLDLLPLGEAFLLQHSLDLGLLLRGRLPVGEGGAGEGKAEGEGGTVRAMQAAFDRNTSINDVEAIRGADLVFTRDDGDLEISFAYEKRLPLAGNVSILIDFSGTTDPSGIVAEASTAAP